jgi:membrane fusion protein, copper/silver efflux system
MKYLHDTRWWKEFSTRHSKIITIGLIVVVFCLGFIFHWLFFSVPEPSPRLAEAARGAEEDKPLFWTCSMHPHIRQPKPGKCPVCGMDLIPVTRIVEEELSLRQITISKAARELMRVQTTPVERRFVTAEIRMVGKVAYDETRFGYTTAWIPGRLDHLFVDYAGVEVKQGDHMVSIYSPELYATQAELIHAVKSTQKRKNESANFSEVINLIESARERLRLWGLTEEQIREIEKKDKPSEHLTIHAPMGGVVIERLRLEGDYVNVGDRIYVIADLSQVWVMLDAYESDLVWLRYGQKITFTTEAYPGEKFTGQIVFISPILNDRTRTVKVRVNVPNPDGKLKPDMFVRGIVHAQVAAAGRVVDPAIAGKWICPMHPEVIEDQSGTCHKCGMSLVTTESLGYIPVEEMPIHKPLVIPVSAALVTGTRAIVYVEVPETELPTFEGREIVLGPRAGGFYLVKTGLQEGEIVVTRGNMKIDSAVQIEAKPSMMTPEGGVMVMPHHGHETPLPEDEQPVDHVEVPPKFLNQLQGLEGAYEAVSTAVEARDMHQIRTAFETLRKALGEINGELLTGHPKMLWREFSMLLNNDTVEGRQVKQLKDADRVFQLLKRHMQRVREQFDITHIDHLPHPPHLIEVPAEFQTQFERLFNSYITLQSALAGDNFQEAMESIPDLQSALEDIDAQILPEDAHHIWTNEFYTIENTLRIMKQSDNLTSLRGNFSPLSHGLTTIIKSFNLKGFGPVYEHYCSMSLDGKGAAWLQRDEDVRNPYFGHMMLRCADRTEVILQDNTEVKKGEHQYHE